MRPLRIFLRILIVSTCAFAQGEMIAKKDGVSAFAGMGIQLVKAGDMVRYINATSTFAQRVDDFGVGIEFFGGIEVPISDQWGLKVEHAYLFKSYTFLATNGATHDLFFAVNAPSVIVQRVVTGKGYVVTFGAGGGYHFGSAEQTISTFGGKTRYTASGIGIKGEIVGQTAFDEYLFGYIGGHIAWDFLGELKDDKGIILANTVRKTQAGLDLFSAGIRFGIIYYL